jgi:UDP-N-acetylmuramyl pentapeptide phosphotransferase/UDP-N-acetylglucosamine-1-phosphate transferase
MGIFLLGAFGIALLASALFCLLALGLFPWFRSGERKPGDFRPDQSAGSGSFQIEVRRGRAKPRVVRARSSELPLVGGVAMLLGIVLACILCGMLLNLNTDQWMLLGIILLVTVGFGIVGFIDDARKVYKGVGISEIQKGIGVILVSGVAAGLLNRLVITKDVTTRLAYPPYTQTPLIGQLLIKQPHAWLVFFIVMTIIVASATALAVDFSDGVDGLAGGLLFSASLAYAAILLDEGGPQRLPLIIGALALAGATLGYLPFNWPSSWRGGQHPRGKRWAKLIMGDTGSLALGGMLAILAIVGRQELLLLVIGGAFVLEGLSAVISARILVKFFRRFLFVERFGSSHGFPHTEFPLPFLATPMHHHYDLLNVDKKRLVYGAWLLGAGLAVLGVATAVGPFTWERYLGRLVGLAILIAVWQAGPWTKAFFIGLEPLNTVQPATPRRLLLCHGAPFRLFGMPLYRRIDAASITDQALREPSERLLLWQRLSVFDARALLGYFCYREGDIEDAHRIWDRIPDSNIEARPDLKEAIAEVTHAIAIQKGGQAPHRTDGMSGDASSSHWRAPTPSSGLNPARLQPLNGGSANGASGAHDGAAMLWQANRWAAASGLTPPSSPTQDPGRTYPPMMSEPPAPTLAEESLREMAALPESDGDASDAMVAHTSFPGAQRPSEAGDI